MLVVGGSLVGLSAAVFLARQACRRAGGTARGSSPHPRAIGYTPRTMELFSRGGRGAARQQPQDPARRAGRGSRASPGRGSTSPRGTPGRARARVLTGAGAAIAQDRLEPILRDRAVASEPTCGSSTELTGFEQDDDGVPSRCGHATVTIQDAGAYLVAADGPRSPIARRWGSVAAAGQLRTRAASCSGRPLEEYLRAGSRSSRSISRGSPRFSPPTDGRWVLMFCDDEERDAAQQRALVQQAVGRPTSVELSPPAAGSSAR